jgi:ataxia telangiectasia mutated family protein
LQGTLLSVFENIDDPDAYYGLPEDASLSKVLSRVEYEKEGNKSLAFRGAQYDSHIRHKNPDSVNDGHALVKALGTLGLSGLSHSLLQTQQNLGTGSSALESTFDTARRLEIWNLPAPTGTHHHAVAVYKAYQSIHQATDLAVVRSTVHDSLGHTMQSLTKSHSAATLRNNLAAMAVLSELDDLLHTTDGSEMEKTLDKLNSRGRWMRSGR